MKKPNAPSPPSSKKPKSRSKRRLRLTREGRAYVAVSIGVGLAAINTGNNLLYLLLGWLLSVILASGFMSNAMLRAIRVERRLPRKAHAGNLCAVGLELHNDKLRLVSYSVTITDMIDDHLLDQSCFALRIEPRSKQQLHYQHHFTRRGRHRFTGFVLATRFPFGLFEKSLRVSYEQEFIALPRLVPTKRLPMSTRLVGDSKSNQKDRQGEFFGLREFREGDDKRAIHWASSARRDRLVVREFEKESQRRVTIVVDNALPRHFGWEQQQALETAIIRAASYARTYAQQNYAVGLVTRGTHIPIAHGQGQLLRIFRTLAVLEAASDDIPFAGNPAPSSGFLLCSATHSDTPPARVAS